MKRKELDVVVKVCNPDCREPKDTWAKFQYLGKKRKITDPLPYHIRKS